MESVLSGFSKVGTARPYNGWSSHFDNEIGFSQEFLLKNHLLLPFYLGFDWSGWIVLIKRLTIIATGWSGRSVLTNGKRHLCVNLRCFLFLLGLTIFLFFIFFLFVVIQFFLYLECSIRLDLKRSFNWIEKKLSLIFYYILKSVEYIVLSRFLI